MEDSDSAGAVGTWDGKVEVKQWRVTVVKNWSLRLRLAESTRIALESLFCS
jgi:hypothetical protein